MKPIKFFFLINAVKTRTDGMICLVVNIYVFQKCVFIFGPKKFGDHFNLADFSWNLKLSGWVSGRSLTWNAGSSENQHCLLFLPVLFFFLVQFPSLSCHWLTCYPIVFTFSLFKLYLASLDWIHSIFSLFRLRWCSG